MERKVLVCMVSVLVFILSGIVQGADLDCQLLHNKYRICIEKQEAGRNLDFMECQGYGDKDTCENNQCFWDTSKNKCYLDICLNDVMGTDGTGSDGKVTTPDYSVVKREFGRFDCETTPLVPAPAPVPKTGQTEKYADYDDGDLEKGVAWPNPRFTDNGDGTVTDNLTGLIWLRDANCFGQRTWDQALSDCHNLQTAYCGLTDGSNIGDWRLPNQGELQSLMHFGFYDPAVPNTVGTGKWSEGDPFINVQYGLFTSYSYWSSTTIAWDTNNAWAVHMTYGPISDVLKTSESFVWPVRGGQ